MWFGDDEIIEGCYFHATLRYKQFSLRKTFHQKPNPLVKRVVNEFISSSFISLRFCFFLIFVFLPLTLAYFLQILYPLPWRQKGETYLFHFCFHRDKYLRILRVNSEMCNVNFSGEWWKVWCKVIFQREMIFILLTSVIILKTVSWEFQLFLRYILIKNIRFHYIKTFFLNCF